MKRKKKLTVVSLLRQAKKLISKYDRWCCGVLAETANGCTVVSKHKRAVRWCAVGSLQKCDGKLVPLATDFLNAVVKRTPAFRARGNECIEDVNDTAHDKRNHKRVLRVFDRAIKWAAKAGV